MELVLIMSQPSFRDPISSVDIHTVKEKGKLNISSHPTAYQIFAHLISNTGELERSNYIGKADCGAATGPRKVPFPFLVLLL